MIDANWNEYEGYVNAGELMEKVKQASQSLQNSAQWAALADHRKTQKKWVLSDLFEENPARFEQFSLKLGNTLYDFSKNLLSEQTLSYLIDLAESAGLKESIDALFSAKHVNTTENRPALHTALRGSMQHPVNVAGEDIILSIAVMREKMRDFSERIRAGLYLGATGKPIITVVNLGVGGSDLGPRMVCEAFKHRASVHVKVLFVSSIDGNEVVATLRDLDPETTLFIVSSKSFSTVDTMANAETAKAWLANHLGPGKKLTKHFIGVSANADAMSEFGIKTENQLPLWDWVGGRYSVWSAIGLSIAISLGMYNFEQFLKGAAEADEHYRNTKFRENIPVIQALIAIWYNNFCDATTRVVLPYDHRMHVLPAFLQQLEMESNGKHVTLTGEQVQCATSPIIWGEFGPNAQHAFYQLLHQGTHFVPAEFIVVANNPAVPEKHQTLAMVNCLAQSRALMLGEAIAKDDSDRDALARHYPGNKPSTTIVLKELTPKSLGSLMACYEHQVYTESVIWNINPFDQWGVELGKKLAGQIQANGNDEKKEQAYDSSTAGLLRFVRIRD